MPSSSIFDESARRGKKPVQDATSKKEGAPSKEKPFGFAPAEAKGPVTLDSNFTLSQVVEFIKYARSVHDDIERQLDEIYLKTGLSPRQVRDFLENPSNFTKEQWALYQSQRRFLQESFGSRLKIKGGPAPGSAETKGPGTAPQKEAAAGQKQHKGKMIGARRNWLPMR